MTTHCKALLAILIFIDLYGSTSTLWSMDRVWTHMTGQSPVEAPPLVIDWNNDGKEEILILNREGQILHWTSGAEPLGLGQDGMVVELPKGLWTSALVPVRIENHDPCLLACSVEGLLVAIDREFHVVWQHQLESKTQYGRAIPLVVGLKEAAKIFIADLSGVVTCLDPAGKVVWKRSLECGPCRAPLSVAPSVDAEKQVLLVGAGSNLLALDPEQGLPLWERELADPILSKAECDSSGDRMMILCGAGEGSLYALSTKGDILWETPIGDQIDSSIAFLSQSEGHTSILCLGLWGNLIALDREGQILWKHLYEAKSRACPLVIDADQDGKSEIYVPTYKHRLYVFDEEGNLQEEVRLGGMANPSVVPIRDKGKNRTDILVATAANCAHRFASGPIQCAYCEGPPRGSVELGLLHRQGPGESTALQVENPSGSCLNIQVSITSTDGFPLKTGFLTSRTVMEKKLPDLSSTRSWTARLVAKNSQGDVIAAVDQASVGSHPRIEMPTNLPLSLSVTNPYSEFMEEGFVRSPMGATPTISVKNLYVDEFDQGSLVLTSQLEQTVDLRIVWDPPKSEGGDIFGGRLTARRVVATGTVNGEIAFDALPPLETGNILTLPPKNSAKIWLSVDGRNTSPGTYRSTLRVLPLAADQKPLSASLEIEVVDLKMPEEFPLSLCVWDYVPNRWFPSNTNEVMDDMRHHGVNVFPRPSCAPKATVDDKRVLKMDWTQLDTELDRIGEGSVLLFHLHELPIEFSGEVSEDLKAKLEAEYLIALRDYLVARGRYYDSYAFYPVDEPGYTNDERVPTLLRMVKLLHRVDPRFRVYTNPVMAFSWKDFESVESDIAIWAPNMRLVTGKLVGDPRVQRMLSSGNEVWSYECLAQVRSLSPLRYNRAYAWRARFFGLSGIGLWTHCMTNTDPWLKGEGISDEFTLVYPGEVPVPSVRWEALRDGMEDIAALDILAKRIESAEKIGGFDEAVLRGKEIIRSGLSEIAELSDEAFIESRDYLAQGKRRIWHSETDAERYRTLREDIATLTLALPAR